MGRFIPRFTLGGLFRLQLAVACLIWCFEEVRVSRELAYAGCAITLKWPIPLRQINTGLTYRGILDPGIYIGVIWPWDQKLSWGLSGGTNFHYSPPRRHFFALSHRFDEAGMGCTIYWHEGRHEFYVYPPEGGGCVVAYDSRTGYTYWDH